MTIKLNSQEAKKRRDIGIKTAIDHANRENPPSWSAQAYKSLLLYLMGRPKGSVFQCEDFRKWYYDLKGLPEPPSERAFGGIIRKAAMRHVIIRTGYRNTSNVSAHKTPAAVWTRNKSLLEIAVLASK